MNFFVLSDIVLTGFFRASAVHHQNREHDEDDADKVAGAEDLFVKQDAEKGGDDGFDRRDDRNLARFRDFLNAEVIKNIGDGRRDQGVEKVCRREMPRHRDRRPGMSEHGEKGGGENIAVGAQDEGRGFFTGETAENRRQGVGKAGADAAENADDGKTGQIEFAAGYGQNTARDVDEQSDDLCPGHFFLEQNDRKERGENRRNIEKNCADRHADLSDGRAVENIVDAVADDAEKGAGQKRFFVDLKASGAFESDGDDDQDQCGESHAQEARHRRIGAEGFHDLDKRTDGSPEGAADKDLNIALEVVIFFGYRMFVHKFPLTDNNKNIISQKGEEGKFNRKEKASGACRKIDKDAKKAGGPRLSGLSALKNVRIFIKGRFPLKLLKDRNP